MPTLMVKERGTGDRLVELNKPRFLIGKREDCDLVLDRQNISRTHCEILQHNGQYVVRDLNSANGTWVNGTKITTPVFLVSGTAIQLGDYTLVFADPAAGAPVGAAPGASAFSAPPVRGGSAFSQQPATVRTMTPQPAGSQAPASPAFGAPAAHASAGAHAAPAAAAPHPASAPAHPAPAAPSANPAAEPIDMRCTRDTADTTPALPVDLKKRSIRACSSTAASRTSTSPRCPRRTPATRPATPSSRSWTG